ncbi:MAG: hypothetical protein EXR80_04015 [Methylococcales bacterium]|nr:hypothetical protein [Methylococcales bacterium]
MRRNIVAHGYVPNTRFFLLALPDHFYLWKDKYSSEIERHTYEIDPMVFLKPYVEKSNIKIEKLSEAGFEILITSWLNELLQLSESQESFKQNKNNKWLVESELLNAIKHGRIASEVLF